MNSSKRKTTSLSSSSHELHKHKIWIQDTASVYIQILSIHYSLQVFLYTHTKTSTQWQVKQSEQLTSASTLHTFKTQHLNYTPNPTPEHSVHLFHRKYFSKTAAILIILSIICCTDPKLHGKKHARVIAHGLVKTMSSVENSFRFSWHKMLILATLINTCPVLVMSYRQGQHQLSHHLTDIRPILI